jgi:hypothetical protein
LSGDRKINLVGALFVRTAASVRPTKPHD